MVSMADVASEADFGGPAWRSGSVWVQSPRLRITTLPPTIRPSTICRHRRIISRHLKATVRRRAAAVRVVCGRLCLPDGSSSRHGCKLLLPGQ